MLHKLLTTLIFTGCIHSVQAKTSFTVIAEDIEDLTQRNGEGLYWDILRTIYPDSLYEIKLDTAPYARGVQLVENHKRDCFLGSNKDELENVFYPKWHIDEDILNVVYIKDSVKAFKGQESLDGIVGWIRSYSYDQYLKKKVKYHEVSTRETGLTMLSAGRISYFVDARDDITAAVKAHPKRDMFEMKEIMRLPTYLTCYKNELGGKLSERFDQEMPKLLKARKIQGLYKKWDVEFTFNPKTYE